MRVDYITFASKISFFEFIQKEFKEPHFKCEEYNDEFCLLKNRITIDYLVKILETHPKIIDIFEEIFQLSRFTNTQYINFCFDVSLLNNSDNKTIISHFEKSILKFENGIENIYLKNIFEKTKYVNDIEFIFNIKRTVIEYIEKILKKKEILYNHIKNSISSRVRISRYLIENLKADEYIEKIDIEALLSLKRNPVDTKSIHGKFGTIKIEKIFEELGFIDLNNKIKEKSIKSNIELDEEYKNKICYLKEKEVDCINKKNDNKPKKFDFILFINGKIKYLIETNFYSTSGTKIGINQNEYIDLRNNINEFNNKNKTNFKFIWVTDGNYWLTKDGENRYKNLKKNHFTKKYELLNYNLLRKYFKKIKLKWRAKHSR